MNSLPSGGRIITFYSYKGGTGRTMALANVAWILASKGKKVLAIDWDLEAPGLHRYFHPFLVDKELAGTEGLIDFVIDFTLKALTPPKLGEDASQQWYLKHADLTRYAISLTNKFPGYGRLDFIPAGRQDSSYSLRVNSFDWQAFYNRLGGGALLEEARRLMRLEYDYVLIDSRTGVSDTSGISTVQMPDSLVVCYTLNNQSIEGASAIAESVAKQRNPPVPTDSASEASLRVFPIGMRVDPFEKDKLTARRRYAETKFAAFPNHLPPAERAVYRAEVEFPYVPFYAYEEVLAPFADQSREPGSLLACSERLTKYLTDGEVGQLAVPPSERERAEVRAQYARQPTSHETIDLLVAYDRADGETAWKQVLAPLENETWKGRKLRLVFHQKDDRPWTAWAESVRPDLLNSRKVAVVISDRSTGFAETFVERELGGSRTPGTSSASLIVLDLRYERREEALKFQLNRIQGGARGQVTMEGFRRLLAFVKDEPWSETVPPSPATEPATVSLPSAPDPRQFIEAARNVLNGQAFNTRELLRLAKLLKGVKQISLARRLLVLAQMDALAMRDTTLRRTVGQQLALCTYKDPDLPVRERLDQALAILAGVDDLATSHDQESLGLAGAIHKRRWEVDGRTGHLETACDFYLRGYQQGVGTDFGYTAINAAFVLDLLAGLEVTERPLQGAPSELSELAQTRLYRARRIREDIVSSLLLQIEQFPDQKLDQQWWFLVTVAEAHFGLRNYAASLPWLKKAAALPGTEVWSFESTARQLAALLHLHEQIPGASDVLSDSSEAVNVLTEFLGRNSAGVRAALLGKVGLALSGGGFRASLYHIGVLARLAELDMLRHVEVLSCVSGGSIIGAQYYLEVRHLLQTKADSDITRDDYVKIVQKIAKEFLAGVQQNIRTRVAASFLDNLKMILAPRTHSRSLRAGELYEQFLFSRAGDQKPGDTIWLDTLLIKPAGEPANFAPKQDNWRRLAKVPILILNATPLNTGHNWQFTATWMGEPPANIDVRIDTNERLRRMYYSPDGSTPRPERRVRLGQAVAASACVPGLFDPISLAGLYPERTVRLVDGGVHDNQGVVSLLEQDCTVLLVSDASGQMNVDPNPCQGALASLLRSNSILMARLREAEFHDLNARRWARLVRGLMFIHLKKDLDQKLVDWVSCEDPSEDATNQAASTKKLTRYGIRKDIQLLLAGVRTDLDSFCDLEAHALMASGYRMTEQEFAKSISGFPLSAAPSANWEFLGVEPAMKDDADPGYPKLKRLLEVASCRAFKIWQLLPALRIAGIILGLVALADIVWLFWNRRADSLLSVGQVGMILGGVILLVVLGKALFERVRLGETIARIILGLFTSTLGWVAARLHLHLFDKLYLKWGRVKR